MLPLGDNPESVDLGGGGWEKVFCNDSRHREDQGRHSYTRGVFPFLGGGRWGVHDRGELLGPLTQVGLPSLGQARLPLGASGYHGFGLCQERLASDGSGPFAKLQVTGLLL